MAGARLTQADRRARSRAALLEATARHLSRAGYGKLVLDAVAADAGYTRGALYHQFAGKDALVLATVDWVRDTWWEEVGTAFDEPLEPHEALVELARRHAVFCRRDIAGVMAALRVEFATREHPIGAAVRDVAADLVRAGRAADRGRARAGRDPRGTWRTHARDGLAERDRGRGDRAGRAFRGRRGGRRARRAGPARASASKRPEGHRRNRPESGILRRHT